jgi:coenzyme Q-binding protein COQ10
MFDLVADLGAYPEFVPHCSDMQIEPAPGGQGIAARMTVNFGPITQAYTSLVTKNLSAGTIAAHASDGPFSHLASQWRFTHEQEEGTRVQFDIAFSFANPLVAAIAEPMFAAAQEEIVNAFMTRAERLYGAA